MGERVSVHRGGSDVKLRGARCVVAAFVCVWLLAPAAVAEELVPLKLDLPKPEIHGTRKDIRAPNLEKKDTVHPPVMVPKDVVNLALGKPVKSSDNEPIIGDLEQITDGEKSGAEGNFVELGPDLQWVQIDLGRVCEVYAVAFWHYHSQERAYHDVVVQCADDADFIETVRTLYNNDHDNSSGLGVGKDKAYVETNKGYSIDAKGVKTRFIRLYSNRNSSNDTNHYIEVEVYGRPAG